MSSIIIFSLNKLAYIKLTGSLQSHFSISNSKSSIFLRYSLINSLTFPFECCTFLYASESSSSGYYELVNEFRRESEGKSFHIVEFSSFLEIYGASTEVVSEVKRTEQSEQKIIKFTAGATNYSINNSIYIMDIAPYIKDGNFFLPVRYLATALGVKPENILWDVATKTLTLIHKDKILQLVAGSNVMRINGIEIYLSSQSEYIMNNLMIEPSHIVAALDGVFFWDEDHVTIFC